MADKTDKEVISLVLLGRSVEFKWIVDRYRSNVYTIAYRILRNREDAEEAAQDAFINCYRGLAGFKWDSGFKTWLYRIAYNQAITRLRERKSLPQVQSYEQEHEPVGHSVSNNGLDKLELEDKRYYINKALMALDEDDAALVTMYYYDELSVDDLHKISGLSRSNIKVKLFRARRQMLDELQDLLKIETGTFYE
jgi:RNA polymerase sigma-70 factor (ECF subfamily)